MSEPLSARPESRFALVSGVAGARAAAAMVFTGVWGLALGCVWHALRKTQSYYRAVLLLAWVVAIGVPTYAGWQIWQGLALEHAVAEASAMDARQLERALDESPWRDNRFFVGAIVQNKASGEALLDRIARLPDPELYEQMGSLWNVQGENRKGIAPMRLIAYHPNVSAATLQRLAEGPHAGKVLHDVLRNRKTPLALLARHFDSTDYQVEWALALNPMTPPAVLERLSNSSNRYTRFNLTYNEATPLAILEKLQQDPDKTLATQAAQAVARHEKRLKDAPNPPPANNP